MKLKSIILSLIVIAAMSACNKSADFNYPAGTVGISKVIFYPSVTINSSRLIIINQGDTYTDPGVTAILNNASTPFTTTGSVNTATAGVYKLLYTASNPQGYTASDWRTVVVIDNSVASNDFSGTYLRAATGVTSTWTKSAKGVYTVENAGGAAVGAGLTLIAVNYTGAKMSIPHQISGDYGEVSSASETYTNTAPIKYSWIFNAGGYGTSLRTFVKQ